MSSTFTERPRSSTLRVPTAPTPAEQRRAVTNLVAQMTVSEYPYVLIWDLAGQFVEAGALYELAVGLSEAVRERRLGRYAIVVATEDQPTIDVLRSLATKHELPLFITPDASRLDAAQPATDLTPGRAAIFRAVSQVGFATVASIANTVGVRHTSASNALSDLADEGLLFRQEGSGRRGHVYFHPKSAVPAGPLPAVEDIDAIPLPKALLDDLVATAEAEGRRPEDLITDAWREYQLTKRDDLAAQYRQMAGLLKSGNRQSLEAAVSRRARVKANRAAHQTDR